MKKIKRLLSGILACVMALSLIPVSTAYAKETVVQDNECIKINPTLATTSVTELNYNDTYQIEAYSSLVDYKINSVQWESNNPNIVSVGATGKQTEVKAVGKTFNTEVTVTGTIRYEAVENSEVEYVTNRTLKFKVVKSTLSLATITDSYFTQKGTTLTAICSAQNQKITWTSSNPNIATVSTSGVVKGVSGGEVTITATTEDGVSASITKEVKIKAENVTLSATATTLTENQTITVVPTFTPNATTNKELEWASSDSSVASVNENGVVTAHYVSGDKTVTITATSKDTGVKGTIKLTVKKPFAEKTDLSVYPNCDKKELIIKDKYTLSVDNTSDFKIKSITWTSSNTNVATVKNGEVTAVSEGDSVISAIVKSVDCGENEYTDKFEIPVRVNKATVKITSVPEFISQDSYTLSATCNAQNQSITWSVDNTSVASLSKGVIKGVTSGTVNVTATADDGSSDTIPVEVRIYPTSIKVELAGANKFTSLEDTLPVSIKYSPSGVYDGYKEMVWESNVDGVVVNNTTNTNANISLTPNAYALDKVTATVTGKLKNFPTITGKVNTSIEIPVSSIKTSFATLKNEKINGQVNIGSRIKLVATAMPHNITSGTATCGITFKSADEKIAKIDSYTGIITGVSSGATAITISAYGKTTSVNVIVKPTASKIKSVSRNEVSKATVTYTLSKDETAKYYLICYVSSDKKHKGTKKVSVDSAKKAKGKYVLSGLKNKDYYIYIKTQIANDGLYGATGSNTLLSDESNRVFVSTVNVKPAKKSYTLNVNKSAVVKATTSSTTKKYNKIKSGTAKSKITFASSNNKVVKINKTTGKMTAVGGGKATITISYKGFKATVSVKVKGDTYEVIQAKKWCKANDYTFVKYSKGTITYKTKWGSVKKISYSAAIK